MTELEDRFHSAMEDLYYQARDECGYRATRFLQLVRRVSGLEAARRLLAASKPAPGLTRLNDCGRVDLAVEALVVRPEFAGLFSHLQRKVAKDRLDALGWDGRYR